LSASARAELGGTTEGLNQRQLNGRQLITPTKIGLHVGNQPVERLGWPCPAIELRPRQ
jgi:hypothetical protein